MMNPYSRHNGNCRTRINTNLTLFSVLLLSLLASVHAQYFIINQPSASSSWANGSPYPVSWTKGLLDGIDTFDVELTRLHEDGLYLVAKDVPSTFKTLNVLLQDVPVGDDYFLLCLNSTHGVTYSVSSRFSVTNSSSGHSNPSPDASAPTVTISGIPDPLKLFAATLGPAANDAKGLVLGLRNQLGAGMWGGAVVICATLLGGVLTLW
ncbi:hypothetical protein HYDPIDRAFT_173709 [Hydnomerulius pinastri MD-312]|nr:hypothetical protein HYDPIDRAFT_173709 [Hydnomerulius pinastri MD-312]